MIGDESWEAGSQILLLVGEKGYAQKNKKKERKKKRTGKGLGACNFCSSFVFVVFDGNTEIICGKLGVVGGFLFSCIPQFLRPNSIREIDLGCFVKG